MQTTNFWNLYNLSSNKIIYVVLLSLIATLSFAQRNISQHDQKRADKGYSYGIHLGLTQHNFRIEHSQRFLEQDEILGIEGENTLGLEFGLIGVLHPWKDIEVRTIPTISFGDQNIIYYIEDLDKPAQYKGESTTFELPLQLKYKSKPYKDFRMFAIGGGKYRNNLSADKEKDQNEQTVQLAKSDFMVEIGAGAEFHFPYFTLAPQLTISQGFMNQRVQNENSDYARPLSALYSRIYSIGINIE